MTAIQHWGCVRKM